MYVIRKIKIGDQKFERKGILYMYGFLLSIFLLLNFYMYRYIQNNENVVYDKKTNYATVICLWTNTYTKDGIIYNVKIDISTLEKIKDLKLNKQEYERAFIGKKFIYSHDKIFKPVWTIITIISYVLDVGFFVIFILLVSAGYDYIQYIIINYRFEMIKSSKLKRRKMIDPYDEEDWRK